MLVPARGPRDPDFRVHDVMPCVKYGVRSSPVSSAGCDSGMLMAMPRSTKGSVRQASSGRGLGTAMKTAGSGVRKLRRALGYYARVT